RRWSTTAHRHRAPAPRLRSRGEAIVRPHAVSPEASGLDPVLDHLDRQVGHYTESIAALVGIPSVSAEGHPADPVRRCAEAVARMLEVEGLENVEVLDGSGVHPYVCADWLHATGAPTVLLYSHYDVQPAGPHDEWRSPPFTPETRAGRLYGRGAADDKGGLVAQVAAVSSLLPPTPAI